MDAKMFAMKKDDANANITHREYCVDREVHFTRTSGGCIEDKCENFRPCNGDCKQDEFTLPENVTVVVLMALRDNFSHRYRKQISVIKSGHIAYHGPNPEYKFPDYLKGWSENEYWKMIE